METFFRTHAYLVEHTDLPVRRASMTKSLETIKDDYMTDDAWNDLNGVPVKNRRGVSKVNYPSTREGFKKLIQAYGTHVIVEAGLGGRLRRSLQMDVTQITTAYDAKAFAKASYDGIVTAEATVDEQFSSSYEENKKNLTITMTVLGGEAPCRRRACSGWAARRKRPRPWAQRRASPARTSTTGCTP